jgi:hypothetical protein
MRPLYENDADRDAEESARRKLQDAWNCELIKLPMRYHCDFAAQRDGAIVGLVEYKRRYFRHDKYPTTILFAEKVRNTEILAGACNCYGYYVAEFDDGLFYLEMNERPSQICIGGRNDRGDPQDIGIVYHWPIHRLKRIM